MLAVLVLAVVFVGAKRLPYVMFSPGGARAVEPLITVRQRPGGPKVHVERPTDDLLYVTVSQIMEPSGALTAYGWLDDTTQVEPAKPYLGTQSSDQNRKLNLQMMTDSQDKARKVALERLGYDVKTKYVGAFLDDVDPTYPAAKVLSPGMTVVAIDGKRVRTVDDLVDAIRAKQPGDEVEVTVVPLGQRTPKTVTTRLGRREAPDERDIAALGVSPETRATFELPVDIDIDTGQVGGPSAGLAFTLAILDRLTPGSLTGGKKVAVTGTIELDGSVGPVGGVDHKTEAAVRQGAELFLVPPDEYDMAKKAARGRIRIEAVSSLDEALAALEANGGDPLPAKAGAGA
ncbi:MAG: S16 family serine protease [Acidimicrobiales bacterium]